MIQMVHPNLPNTWDNPIRVTAKAFVHWSKNGWQTADSFDPEDGFTPAETFQPPHDEEE